METIKVLFTSSMSIYCTFCQLIRELTTVFFIQDEWRYLLSGGTVVPKQIDNPAPDWLSDRAWSEVLTLSALVSKTHLYTRLGKYYLGFLGGRRGVLKDIKKAIPLAPSKARKKKSGSIVYIIHRFSTGIISTLCISG